MNDFVFPEFLDPSVVELYLKFNPRFLDEYVRTNVQQLQIAKWLDFKADENESLNSSGNKYREYCLCLKIVLILFTVNLIENEITGPALDINLIISCYHSFPSFKSNINKLDLISPPSWPLSFSRCWGLCFMPLGPSPTSPSK